MKDVKPFTEVNLSKRVFETTYKIGGHELFLSFTNDNGAYAFEEWWFEEGSMLFNQWLKDGPEYGDEHEK